MTKHIHGNMVIRGVINGLVIGVGIGLITFAIFTTVVVTTESISKIIIGVLLIFLGFIMRRYDKYQINHCDECRRLENGS